MRGIRTSLQATKISVNETTAKETKLTMSAHMRGLHLQTTEWTGAEASLTRENTKRNLETWSFVTVSKSFKWSSKLHSSLSSHSWGCNVNFSQHRWDGAEENNAHTTKKMRRQELAAPWRRTNSLQCCSANGYSETNMNIYPMKFIKRGLTFLNKSTI